MWSDNLSHQVSGRSAWCNSHKAVRPSNEHEWLLSQLKTTQDDFVLDLQDSNSPQSWKSSLFSQPCGTFSTATTSRNFRNWAQGERWDGLGKFLLPVKHLPLGENEKNLPSIMPKYCNIHHQYLEGDASLTSGPLSPVAVLALPAFCHAAPTAFLAACCLSFRILDSPASPPPLRT